MGRLSCKVHLSDPLAILLPSGASAFHQKSSRLLVPAAPGGFAARHYLFSRGCAPDPAALRAALVPLDGFFRFVEPCLLIHGKGSRRAALDFTPFYSVNPLLNGIIAGVLSSRALQLAERALRHAGPSEGPGQGDSMDS